MIAYDGRKMDPMTQEVPSQIYIFLLVRGLPAQWGERIDNSRPYVKFWCIFRILFRTAGEPSFQSTCTRTATLLWKQTSNVIFSTPYEQDQFNATEKHMNKKKKKRRANDLTVRKHSSLQNSGSYWSGRKRQRSSALIINKYNPAPLSIC